MTLVDRAEVQTMLADGAQLVDVRSAAEYAAEHIPGAINIPLGTLGRETVRPLDAGRALIVYCHDTQ